MDTFADYEKTKRRHQRLTRLENARAIQTPELELVELPRQDARALAVVIVVILILLGGSII